MARNEVTGKTVATKAARILRDPKSSKATRSVAASALTQHPTKNGQTKRPRRGE